MDVSPTQIKRYYQSLKLIYKLTGVFRELAYLYFILGRANHVVPTSLLWNFSYRT